MESQTYMTSWSTHDINSAKEEVFSIPNEFPPFDFGFLDLQYQDLNGFEAYSLMNIISNSKDPFYSSLDIVPSYNHCFLADSMTYTPLDDFMNVCGINSGFFHENDDALKVNTSAVVDQSQPPLIDIINANMMNDNHGVMVRKTVSMGDLRMLDKGHGENASGSTTGCSSYTSKTILTREIISQYFYMPITQAAKELNVGLTLLKKRCRELGIRRWPHRKLMSLQTLINNVQQLGEDSSDMAKRKMKEAVMLLEKERKKMEQVPDLKLENNTKRLRQACFKANYKRRRSMNAVQSPLTSVTGPQKSVSSCSSTCSINLDGYEALDDVYGVDKEQEEMKPMLFEDCFFSSSNTMF
ncbi:hypothetical protein QVD17_10644 [Tagetes erecta]|uniref:RWP-RK domain-containing protein n=1 Tax=Tagetes erecta TaxID=13708 RepID=A0AAD8P650_TARER|nr:hypothetical protein QVD17_10644 [Tagetes erecta]